MKRKLIILSTVFLLIGSISIAQPLMETIHDAAKIKSNEKLFINKPMKLVLMNIGPEIKMVSVRPTNNPNFQLGYFIFRFVDAHKYDSFAQKNKYPIQITVFVKEPFSWDYTKRPAGDPFQWTKEDVAKFGDLTVVGIRVYGDEEKSSKSITMPQEILITDKGFDKIKVGDKIDLQNMNFLSPFENYVNKDKIRLGLVEKYKYYFLKKEYLNIKNLGLAKDIFIASDNNNKIISIFIFLKHSSEVQLSNLDQIFESTALRAQSGIGDSTTSILNHWQKNGISLLYRKNISSGTVKITIQKSGNEPNYAGVYFN